MLDRDRVSILIEQTRDRDANARQRHALGAHLVREHFHRVERLQRRQADGVYRAEEEDEREPRAAGGGIGVFAVGDDASGCGDEDPDDGAAGHGKEHQGPAADALDEGSAGEGEDELEAGVAEVDVGLGDAICDADGSEDSGEEVGEGPVAGPLGADDEEQIAEHAVHAAAGAEDATVIPEAFVGAVDVEMFLIFGKFKLDPGGVGVAVAVPFGEHVDGLFALVVDVEPTWRFGNGECEEGDETREEHLKPDWDLETDVSLQVETTADSSGSQDRSGEPEGIAVGGQNTAESRMGGLDDVDRTCRRHNADAKPKEESTTFELSNWNCHQYLVFYVEDLHVDLPLPLLVLVPQMITPPIIMMEPMNMPTLRPHVSMAGPVNGRAATDPIWYMEETIPAQIPAWLPWKWFRKYGLAVRPPKSEPSKPFMV